MKPAECLHDLSRLLVAITFLLVIRAHGAVLWSDFGPVLAHDTGAGDDILLGAVKRDESSSDALYFKFHVLPLSDVSTEPYLAAFQLYEGSTERLGIGNSLKAWAYDAFNTVEAGNLNGEPGEFDLRAPLSSPVKSPTLFTTYAAQYPSRGKESTIVFKVQYVPGTNAQVTVWLDPDLGVGATEEGQNSNLVTHFTANASFDEIHLRHVGGGDGWIFSDMVIATSFSDFVAVGPDQKANVAERESGGPPFEFRSWQREQDAPRESVHALAQDRQGYLWLGTDDGITRFDGARFVSFGVADGLPVGGVQVLLADHTGTLWAGTEDGGLARWHHGKFNILTKNDGLPDNAITALAEDGQGRIWIGTAAGLSTWQDGRIHPAPGESGSNAITALFVDRQGIVWVGVTGVGIVQYLSGKSSLFESRGQGVLENNLLKDSHCLLVDRKGRLWVGAGDGYLLCCEDGKWVLYRIPHRATGSYVSTLTEGLDGAIWAGSAGDGMLRFESGVPQIVNAGSGLSDNSIESLLVDGRGNLWVGTEYGLNQLTRGNLFTFSSREGLGYGAVQGMAEVAPGLVWIGKADDGLYCWDGTNVTAIANHELFQGYPEVRALLTTQEGTCWVAGSQGLWLFNHPATDVNSHSLELPKLAITALCQDSNKEIWAGTQEGELWRRRDGEWTAQTNFSRAITALLPGKDGTLWIGTAGAGLFKRDGNGVAHFNRLKGLLSETIHALFFDKNGVLWIGTAGGGLSRLREGQVFTFTTREGLPDNTITQILEDESGRLWLGTSHGIAAVARDELERCAAGKISTVDPQLYGRDDGMLSEECTGGFFPAGLKTRSGLLCFSTERGLVVIDPKPAAQTRFPPPQVVLEGLVVDGAAVRFDSKTSPLRLSAGSHRLEIRYTALNFADSERIHFRYQLEGLDNNWIEVGEQRTAVYNYVAPGNYRFLVQACDVDGAWQQSDANLGFVFPHPVWQTWWFMTICSIGSLAVVGMAVRVVVKRRVYRRVKQLEQERALERERTRIAQDLHDEMGAKLCRISYLSRNVVRKNQENGEVQEQIAAISETSHEMLQALDEIVWAVNPKNDTLEKLAFYVAQVASEYFEMTGIECEVNIPDSLPPCPLSSQTRHHLFLIVHEALTNILKHSKATRAAVRMKSSAKEFDITISDNGTGFDAIAAQIPPNDGRETFGNGLCNMRQRITEIGGQYSIQSQPGHGTILRLTIPLNGV